MGLLNRDALLTRQQLKIEKVVFEDNSEDYVYVREMTGHDRDKFENSIMEMKKVQGAKRGEASVEIEQHLDNFRAKLAVVTVCDENGDLLLKPSDVDSFAKAISISRLEKIVEVASRMNKISEKDKEDLLKNSTAILEDNSSLDSVES